MVNADITRAVEGEGLYFAPDPSSQKACTIGGNVSENSGGPHTLAYGVTVNHIAALEMVLPDGEIVRIGNKHGDAYGYDLCGVFVGSEGTLALVTEVTVKLSQKAEAVKTLLRIFDSIDDASQAVVEITARGITPAACEMVDGVDAQGHRGLHSRGIPARQRGDFAAGSGRVARIRGNTSQGHR